MQIQEESRSLILEVETVPGGKRPIPPPLLGALAVCILAGILVAGLWPFHSPKNDVTWLARSNGLRFGRYGTILSSGVFNSPITAEGTACSLEIWLHPRKAWQRRTLLSFDSPRSPLQFSLRQSNPDLELRMKVRDARLRTQWVRFYIGNIFRKRKLLFITITSGAGETAVYADGGLVQVRRGFPPIGNAFQGRLVVANSPIENDSWPGVLRGLAIYRRELSPEQVKQHYESWTRDGRPEIAATEDNIALYLFNERGGSVAHNQVSGGTDLTIPARYTIVREKFLEPPWSEFQQNRDDLKSVLMNIVGLIPLGFIFYAFFSCDSLRIKHPALLVIVLGFATSVTIEVLQSFLPTRDSGMTDIITNTLGTSLGVLLYRSSWVRITLSRIPLFAFFLP